MYCQIDIYIYTETYVLNQFALRCGRTCPARTPRSRCAAVAVKGGAWAQRFLTMAARDGGPGLSGESQGIKKRRKTRA
jgi:hypothetical protein